jgi:hypothetical protein
LQLSYHGGPGTGLFVRSKPIYIYGYRTLDAFIDAVWRLAHTKDWVLVAHDNGFYLFQRGGASRYSQRLVEAWLMGDSEQLWADFQKTRSSNPVAWYLNGDYGWEELFVALRQAWRRP